MKIAKKIAAALLAAAMAFTALVIPVGADSIEDTAVSLKSGESYSKHMYNTYNNGHYGTFADYKLTATSQGKLSLSITSTTDYTGIILYDSNFNSVSVTSYEITTGWDERDWTGREKIIIEANSIAEKSVSTVNWDISKGTYYLRIYNNMDWTYGYRGSNGDISFTATFPSTAKKAKISYININLAKGSTLSLGATVTNGGTVTWKSSNSSVVTVSSAGSITAKGKGSAIITAKCGSSSKKVKIVVS